MEKAAAGQRGFASGAFARLATLIRSSSDQRLAGTAFLIRLISAALIYLSQVLAARHPNSRFQPIDEEGVCESPQGTPVCTRQRTFFGGAPGDLGAAADGQPHAAACNARVPDKRRRRAGAPIHGLRFAFTMRCPGYTSSLRTRLLKMSQCTLPIQSVRNNAVKVI